MQPSDPIGQFAVHRFPDFRNPTIDILTWGRKRHHIPILLEIDVTEARHAIREQHAKTGQRISFTGWVVACLARCDQVNLGGGDRPIQKTAEQGQL